MVLLLKQIAIEVKFKKKGQFGEVYASCCHQQNRTDDSTIYFEHEKDNVNDNMKSFIAKRVNSILVNLRYLRFKLLKYKENYKKICNTFDHNFKISFIYNEKGIISMIRKVLFCIIQWCPYFKNVKNGA